MFSPRVEPGEDAETSWSKFCKIDDMYDDDNNNMAKQQQQRGQGEPLDRPAAANPLSAFCEVALGANGQE